MSTDQQHQRNNLEAWMAARCDGEHFGELVAYKFPSTRQVQGPLQVGGRLNQDAEMSKNFTQWNQQGSKVILGDMRVLPLSDHRLLSVQSIFLESEGVGVQMPQLMYVVVASGDRVVYGKSFDEALHLLIHDGDDSTMTAGAVATKAIRQAKAQSLVERLRHYFTLLQQMKLDEAGKELQSIREQINTNEDSDQEDEQ